MRASGSSPWWCAHDDAYIDLCVVLPVSSVLPTSAAGLHPGDELMRDVQQWTERGAALLEAAARQAADLVAAMFTDRQAGGVVGAAEDVGGDFALELGDALHSATEAGHRLLAAGLAGRADVLVALDMTRFAGICDLAWSYIVRTESACQRMVVALRGELITQVCHCLACPGRGDRGI